MACAGRFGKNPFRFWAIISSKEKNPVDGDQ